jgi:hypothetical protein
MLRHSPRDDMTYSVIMAIGTLYGRGIYKMITVPGIHLAPSQNRLAEIMSSARRRGAGRRRLPQGRRVAGRRAAEPVYQDRAQGHKQGRRGVKDTMRGRRDTSLC